MESLFGEAYHYGASFTEDGGKARSMRCQGLVRNHHPKTMTTIVAARQKDRRRTGSSDSEESI